MLQDLDALAGCPALCTASVASNAITSVEGLHSCSKLAVLDLGCNLLASTVQLRPLAALRHLEHLRLAGNPLQPPRLLLRSLMPGESPAMLALLPHEQQEWRPDSHKLRPANRAAGDGWHPLPAGLRVLDGVSLKGRQAYGVAQGPEVMLAPLVEPDSFGASGAGRCAVQLSTLPILPAVS